MNAASVISWAPLMRDGGDIITELASVTKNGIAQTCFLVYKMPQRRHIEGTFRSFASRDMCNFAGN